MYSRSALLDVVTRTNRSAKGMLDHCRSLSAEELHRPLDGFGYATVQQQLHHICGAQRYWIGVLEGRMDVDENEAAFPGCDELEAFRSEMEALVVTYLGGCSDDDLSRARPVTTWGDNVVELAPAQVILRIMTHCFQHQGQIAAMCRLLGKPIPAGLDFPIR